MRRMGLLLSTAIIVATGALALGLSFHFSFSDPFFLLHLLLALIILSLLVLTTVLITERQQKYKLDDLGRMLAAFREAPSPSTLEALSLARETRLHLEVAQIAASYRQALDTIVRTQEMLAHWRGGGPVTDAERGHSHSAVHVGGFLRSSRLIARLTPTFHWIGATASLQRLLGRPLPELSGRSFLEFVPEPDVSLLVGSLQDVLREGEGHDITFRLALPDGRERHVQADVLARYTEDGRPLHLRCHLTDVTDRVRAEEQLRLRSTQLSHANALLRQSNAGLERLKESYRDLYHQAPVLYFSVDAQGRLTAFNDTLIATLGYARSDLLTRPYTRLLPASEKETFDSRVFQDPGEIEGRWVKHDGTVIDVWIRTSPLLNEDGTFVRSRSAAQDVTERNRLADALRAQATALHQANEDLRRINQELEEFTYVVSHDLKEPLRTIEAFSTFLRKDHGEALGESGREQIDHLVAASRRLGQLIDDLLSLSRAGKILGTRRTFPLQEVVDMVLADLGNLIHRRGAAVRVEGPLPTALADRERVVQLLTNLVGNGLKYNRNPRPEVVIGTRPMNGSATEAKVLLFVRDNGIGIARQYHDQVFRLFRRLHRREDYEGTGAGLAICKKIVEAHGGQIWIESEVGRGATFLFTLPAATNGAVHSSGEKTT